jgi:hypothetical protein
VYSNEPSDKQKSKLKSDIRKFIEKDIEPLYFYGNYEETKHIENINKISLKSEGHADILNNGKFNFGVSQKLLNLYLKYLWCLDRIPEPPHFPVDRRIQENIKLTPIVSCTKFKDEIDFMKVIDYLKGIKKPNDSLAQFELKNFERRVRTDK